jgi:transcriptional regulator with XRE-family HTH domain
MRINKERYNLARAKACLSQADVIKSGVSKGTVSAIMHDKEFNPDTVGRIAKALNVSVEYLIGNNPVNDTPE